MNGGASGVEQRVTGRPAPRRGPLPLLAAAAVGFGAVGVYVLVWRTYAVPTTCRPVGLGDCMGGPLAMVLVGLPLLYAVWAAGLRLSGARYAWSAPPAIGLAMFVLARMTTPFGTPVLVWLVAAAVLSAAWRWRFSPVR